MNEPRQPGQDPHADLGSMDPARQAPLPGVEPTTMPENEPGFARASEPQEERRGPLWDEPSPLTDEERRGPLWEPMSGGSAAEQTVEEGPAAPPMEPTVAEAAVAESAAAAVGLPLTERGWAEQAATEPVSAEPTAPEAPATELPDRPADSTPVPAVTEAAVPAHDVAAGASRTVEPSPATPRFDEPPTAASAPEQGEMPAGAVPPSDRPAAQAPEDALPRYTPDVVGERKDPSTAFLLELIPGLFGFLGIGYLYVGRTNEGVIRLAAFLIYNLLAWTAIFVLSVVIVGLCLIPVQIAIQIGVPIWSALQLRKELDAASPRAGARI